MTPVVVGSQGVQLLPGKMTGNVICHYFCVGPVSLFYVQAWLVEVSAAVE